MSQTVSNAVAQREESPGAFVAKYTEDFTRVLPAHIRPETFVRLAQGVLRRDENLARTAQRNPGSLLVALLDCARLGHDPGTEAYYLVPIGGAVEGWEGYRGVIERIYRAGAVTSVKAEVVRANDHYRYLPNQMALPEHEFDDFASEAERGELRGVYAYAEMAGGGYSRVVRLSKEQVMKRKAMAHGTGRADSPWVKWEAGQWLKCAAHELEKWVPSSSEYRRQVALATNEAAKVAAENNLPPMPPAGDVVDGEVVWPATAVAGEQA